MFQSKGIRLYLFIILKLLELSRAEVSNQTNYSSFYNKTINLNYPIIFLLISYNIRWNQLKSIDIGWYQLISIKFYWYQLMFIAIDWYLLNSIEFNWIWLSLVLPAKFSWFPLSFPILWSLLGLRSHFQLYKFSSFYFKLLREQNLKSKVYYIHFHLFLPTHL